MSMRMRVRRTVMRVPIGLRMCMLAVVMGMRFVVGVLMARMLLLPIYFAR